MICPKCNKEKIFKSGMNVDEDVCLCPPKRIGSIEIPQNPTTNPEYTMKMLSIMYVRHYYKGEVTQCADLLKTLGYLKENVQANLKLYRGEESIVAYNYDEDKYSQTSKDI